MAKRRKIIKIRLSEKYFDQNWNSLYHHRENPIVLGYLAEDGNYYVQTRPDRKSYTWFVDKDNATVVNKPLILISVESEDTRKAEPQAQNKQ